MTTKKPNTINPKSLKLASSALMLALSQLSPTAFAANITWNNTGTDFDTGSNWTGATAPANTITGDTAIFDAATTAIPSLAVNRSILGMDFTAAAGGSTLTSAANVTLTLGAGGIDATGQLTAGTNTVSVANLKIGAAQTWTLFSNTSNTTSNPTTFSVSSNIDLNGQNLVVLANRNGATGNAGVVNLSGNITGTSGGNGLILSGNSAFRNTINLTGANTYSGLTTITNVTVTANSLADSGSASALGQSGEIRLGSAGTTSGVVLTFNNLTSNGTTNRLVTTTSAAGSGVVINNNDADNTVAFTNAGSLDTSGSSTSNLSVILGGTNTGDNVFGQVINERAGTGVTNFTKSGLGKWVLTGTNTYTGVTTIQGTLQVDSIGNGGIAGNLGAATSAASNVVISNAGILRYTSAGESTDRLFTVSHNVNGGASTLDASGSGAIAFTNTGPIAYAAGSNLTRTLKLLGTNTGNNSLAALIGNDGTGAVSVSKSGTGTWVLSGANTYTGTTTVSGGTLLINGNQSAATGAVSVASTATLGGSGTIGGATTIANGAFLAPGNSPGVLTFGSSLTLNATSTTTMELAGNGGVAGTDFDKIVVTGAIAFNGTLNIVSSGGYDLNQTATYDLFDFGGSSGNFANVSIAATALTNNSGIWTGSSGQNTYTFSQVDGTLSVVSAVPEPSTYAALAGLGMLGFAVYRRRKAS